jgi:hypothetical protein
MAALLQQQHPRRKRPSTVRVSGLVAADHFGFHLNLVGPASNAAVYEATWILPPFAVEKHPRVHDWRKWHCMLQSMLHGFAVGGGKPLEIKGNGRDTNATWKARLQGVLRLVNC